MLVSELRGQRALAKASSSTAVRERKKSSMSILLKRPSVIMQLNHRQSQSGLDGSSDGDDEDDAGMNDEEYDDLGPPPDTTPNSGAGAGMGLSRGASTFGADVSPPDPPHFATGGFSPAPMQPPKLMRESTRNRNDSDGPVPDSSNRMDYSHLLQAVGMEGKFFRVRCDFCFDFALL